ncbi:MAG TPA: signal peptidase II [Gemmatimonadales bacterium]|jgi:signal peptidase II|nr:signal peptidase II [Gemmatimonadales bacterium]
MPSAADRRSLFATLVLLTVILDRLTKMWAERTLALRGVVPVVGDTIQLRLVYNPGAAFGLNLGSWSRWAFLSIAVIAIILLYRMAQHALPFDRLRQFSVGFVAGGAAGNLVDRILSSRGVVDFIDVGVNSVRWPTFNVADIAVSCGAIVLAFSLWREDARRATASVST